MARCKLFTVFMAVVMFTTSVGVINKVHHCLAQESKSLCQENESCCENEVERNAECCHDDVKAMLLDVTYINKQQKHTIIDVAFSVTIFIKQLFVFLNDTKNYVSLPPDLLSSCIKWHPILRI
jgi:hypothetical protein